MSYRIICWDDVFLASFDVHGNPQWGDRDEAAEYGAREPAHEACREARKREGLVRGTVFVRHVRRPMVMKGTDR